MRSQGNVNDRVMLLKIILETKLVRENIIFKIIVKIKINFVKLKKS